MSKKVIRRKTDGADAEPVAEPTPVEADAPVAPASVEPPPVSEIQHMDLDDLSLLADMDPSELASLMDGNLKTVRVEVGDEVSGTVTRVARDDVFVDIGGKSEATIDRDEVPDVKAGDTVSAWVVQTQGGWRLSKKLSGAAAGSALEAALESGMPVEGLVTARNKGGYTVRIGDIHAFCPGSLISRLPLSDPDSVLNEELQFRVIETGDKIVLSRRALEEEEAEEEAERFWAMVAIDTVYKGTVRNVQPFGAFVDLGGVDGLIPNRESSWGHGSAADVVQVGQTVSVRVIDIDRAAKKLTLSLKDPEASPWSEVGTRFLPGGVYPGTVAKVADFGVFVGLAPGLQGLIHNSRLVGTLEVGANIDVRLLEVDHERRRLDLAPVGDGATEEVDVVIGTEVSGTVTEVRHNGVSVVLDDGRSAWLPASEANLPAGTVVHQRFRRGRPITARIRAVQGNRVTLTQRAEGADSDQSWRRQLGGEQTAGGFGTLADLLGGVKFKG